MKPNRKKTIIDVEAFDEEATAAYVSQRMAREERRKREAALADPSNKQTTIITNNPPSDITVERPHEQTVADPNDHPTAAQNPSPEEHHSGKTNNRLVEESNDQTAGVEDMNVVPPDQMPAKKMIGATTIMPVDVFAAFQNYATRTATPKHRLIYLFIIEGLLAHKAITKEQYDHYRMIATQLPKGKKQKI